MFFLRQIYLYNDRSQIKEDISKHRNPVQNMLIIIPIFILLINSSGTYGLCSNDNECPYYCGTDGRCQKPILRGQTCSGYFHHIQECDIASWCDPDKNLTCQLLQNVGEKCQYDYSCVDHYCDSATKTCQYRQFIGDQCQTNRSCHSNYCETETTTCQTIEESSSPSVFRILLIMFIACCIVFGKKTPQNDVATQTDDA